MYNFLNGPNGGPEPTEGVMSKVFAGANLEIAGIDSLSFPARQMVRQIPEGWEIDLRSSSIEVSEGGDVTESVRFVFGDRRNTFTFVNGVLNLAGWGIGDSCERRLEGTWIPAFANAFLGHGRPGAELLEMEWDDEMIAVTEHDEIAAEATWLGQENAKGDAPWTREMSERYAEILEYDTY